MTIQGMTLSEYRNKERIEKLEQERRDQQANRAGLAFGSRYNPPTVAPDSGMVHDLKTYSRETPPAAPALFLNLPAVEVAMYLLGKILWVRAIASTIRMPAPLQPPDATNWPDDVLTLGFLTWQVTYSNDPLYPANCSHDTIMLFLKSSDFLSHDRPEADRPAEWVGWNGDRPIARANRVPAPAEVVYLRGIATKTVKQLVRHIVGAWVSLGRERRLPWEGRKGEFTGAVMSGEIMTTSPVTVPSSTTRSGSSLAAAR